jgi:uncharacterized membrane protein YfcA
VNLELDTVLLIFAAFAAGSFIKGATGAGLPQVAIPVMATFLGVEAAVVIMAIPGIVTNTWLLWTYRDHFGGTRDLPAILATGTVGAILGTVLLDTLAEDLLAFVVAGVVCLYAVVFFTHPEFGLSARVTRYSAPPVGLASGVLQGATGMSGPLIATYLHSYRLPKEAYVVSITTVFQVFAIVQSITLLSVGLYSAERLVVSLLALIPTMLVLPFGARFAGRLSRRTFDLTVLGLLIAAAVKLVYDALT